MQMKMRKHISLSITELCNLDCIYCFEKSKAATKMSFETAVRIIKNEIQQPSEYQSFYFDFMGGEPFLLFDLMKSICEYFWKRSWEKDFIFYTTTNGTLVHGEIQKWLTANKDRFVCCLSLDGHSEAHNINRCNSFNQIDINFFRETWPYQKVKSIISEKTIPMMYDCITYLHELGFNEVESKLAYGFDWNKKEHEFSLLTGLEQLIEYYLASPDIIPFTLLNMDITNAADPASPIRKWCNAGGRTISYDMNGDKYPCRYFQDIRKNGKASLDEIWQVDYSKIQETLSEPCRICLLKNLCRTCYALNYEQNGNFGIKTLSSCKVTRISAYMTSLLKLELLRRKYNNDLSFMDENDQKLFAAIKKVQGAYRKNGWF